jgi:DNA polymerase (family 10)
MMLHKKLGIKSVAQLEKAARAGKIRKLKGFGPKSEEDILRGIEMLKRGEERKLLGTVLPLARALEASMKKVRDVKQAVAAGSVRRMKETVGDIDILTISKNSKPVMDAFTKMPEVVEVLAKGPTKSTVILSYGKHQIQADVRVLEEKSFGAALQYFTGSKDHNIKLRQIAIKKGYKLSEYGLFIAKTGRYVAGRTEAEVYKKLGLPYIEPELRENRGEIEAAQAKKLPKLIPYNAIKGDLQMHTKWSDGSNTIEEMASAAQKMGYKYIAITDHSKSQHIAHGLDEKRLAKYLKALDAAQKKFPNIRILKGSEVDVLPNGKLDYSDRILKQLDIVVAGVHSRFKSPKAEMTKRIVKAFSNKYIHVLAHPTGRVINVREPYEFDLEKVFQAAIDNNVALEINAFPSRLDLKDVHIKLAKDFGVKLSMGTDSHSADHLRYIEFGIAQARRGWAESKDILNTLPFNKLEKFLKR